jgi:hypothetical protein
VLGSGALLPSFRLVGRLRRGAAHVADKGAERLGDGLVTVAGGVLVDHRRADAGVAERAISSLSVAPAAAERVPPVCRRS